MRKIYLMILCVFFVGLFSAQAQSVAVRGTVTDESGAPLIGATVAVPGTSIGTSTDVNGQFNLGVGNRANQIEITYIGYKTVVLDFVKGKARDFGAIKLAQDANVLEDVVITQSVAIARKTPVALSTISLDQIEEKLGTQEFPEVLKSTPGVYATKNGGGFGDSKINMRGFQSANVAVMINGVPVNDMEWGGVYWSNWAGLSDVTRSMQTQRGLGASKVSSPSVGGTINIVTKSLDAERGGTVSYSIGNDLSQSVLFSVSTGLTKNGWALTVLGGRKWGNGYIQGTDFDGYNYFVNVAKRINKNHQLSLTAFGAPQSHYQRSNYDGLTIKGWQEVKKYMGEKSAYRYNPTFGYDKNGQRRTSAYNKFHKPMISLNHQWQINDHSSLSSSAYVSISSGYGYGGDGATSNDSNNWYGSSNGSLNTTFRKADGTFDYGAIQDLNAASTTGSKMIMARSVNDHQWYGLLSTYTNRLNDKWEISAGLDMRYYVCTHTKEIDNLYDGAYYIDRYRANVLLRNNANATEEWQQEKLTVGDNIYRNYDGHVLQAGVFGQAEYTGEKITAFVSGSISNNTYWKVDKFYYDKAHGESQKVNFLGGTVKAGLNYNITQHHNIFANVGFISRAPFMSGGAFLNITTSNTINADAVNEKIFSAEVGYGFKNEFLRVNFNAYYTLWMDKTSTATGNDYTYVNDAGQTIYDRPYINLAGVDARHMGLELDFSARATKWLDITGMLSWGDWQWNSNSTGYWYNGSGQPMADTKGTVASAVGITKWTPEVGQKYGVAEADFKPHAWSTINTKGFKVGGSAQTTAALGLNFKPLKGLRVGVDWTVYARLFADYSISNPSINYAFTPSTPWQIPWGNQFDLNASYSFKIGKCNATIYGNINNVFNQEYIVDAYNGATSNWDSAYRVFYAFGRTFSVRLKVRF